MGGLIVLSCGGYRSGSTLQYNLAGEYAERANAGRRVGFVEPEQVALLDAVWSFVEALGVAVAKCHLAPGAGDGSAHWRRFAEQGRLLAVYTVRDWRDVVHSWSRMFEQDLEQVFAHPRWSLNLANLESWLAEGARVQRYETLVADPLGALRELAVLARLPVDGDAMTAAAQAAGAVAHARPERTPARTAPAAAGPGSPVGADSGADARTLVHAEHIADPEGGGWRGWTSAERARVARHIAPLMERFGYDWGPDW